LALVVDLDPRHVVDGAVVHPGGIGARVVQPPSGFTRDVVRTTDDDEYFYIS
jgi:hypothetical protein